MFKVIMQKHVIHDTSFWAVWYAKHFFVYHCMGAQKCKIDCTIRYFQALLCFYTRIFQTSSNQGV